MPFNIKYKLPNQNGKNSNFDYSYENYFYLEGELTDEDIEKINKTIEDIKKTNKAGKCVIVYNSAGRKLDGTKGERDRIAPEQLFKITDKDVLFSDTTSYDYLNQDKFNNSYYKELTLHSARDLSFIYSRLDKIADYVNTQKEWSDVDKALYGFLKLGDMLQYEYKNKDHDDHMIDNNGRDFLRSLVCVLNHQYGPNGVCAGISDAYTTLLQRMGVDCEYVEKVGEHAWVNLILKDASGNFRTIPVDLTWAMTAMGNMNYTMKDVLRHFGMDEDFYEPYSNGTNPHGIPRNERILDSMGKAVTFPQEVIRSSFKKISKVLYSKKIDMIKNTAITEEGELYFAEHPEIGTKGLGFRAYILYFKGKDGSRRMKLLYADNDIDMSKVTYDEIDKALTKEQKGYLGDKSSNNRAWQEYEMLCDRSINPDLFQRADITTLDGSNIIAMLIGIGGPKNACHTGVDETGGSGEGPCLKADMVSMDNFQLTNEQLNEKEASGGFDREAQEKAAVQEAQVDRELSC